MDNGLNSLAGPAQPTFNCWYSQPAENTADVIQCTALAVRGRRKLFSVLASASAISISASILPCMPAFPTSTCLGGPLFCLWEAAKNCLSTAHKSSRVMRFFCLLLLPCIAVAQTDPLDLRPISTAAWNADTAQLLSQRAGFGASIEEVKTLSRLKPAAAVALFIDGPSKSEHTGRSEDQAFVHSGVFADNLEPFPASRPATTAMAKRDGEALGIAVKAGGDRPIQPIVNEFFYWLRASRLETDRVAYWWANRMLTSKHPLQEKMALFWHGHFATSEAKVRDYRKMLQQVELFQAKGLGNFRELLIGVAQDPAMLVFLDAGVNTKDSPNENFAREIMELFTMGVGHYSEQDVREAARAFTGWSVEGLTFFVDAETHDDGLKVFLGKEAAYDGIGIIDRILAQPQTAEFIATKLYRYFVAADLSPAGAAQLGRLLVSKEYLVDEFLRTLLTSRAFYASRAQHIKSPVELVISTYKKLGLTQVPGIPDFNYTTDALGQRLLYPPTVAGWSQGRSWITPSLLFERANFVLDVAFPDIGFIAPDRYPMLTPEIVNVQDRLRSGMNIATATKPTNMQQGGEMAQSNLMADRDEAFNTRYGSMRGWQMAIERVLPIPRHTARLNLAQEVTAAALATPAEVVEFFEARFFSVSLSPGVRETLTDFLRDELGTTDIPAAASYLEEPLRKLLHLMLSRPEYQLS